MRIVLLIRFKLTIWYFSNISTFKTCMMSVIESYKSLMRMKIQCFMSSEELKQNCHYVLESEIYTESEKMFFDSVRCWLGSNSSEQKTSLRPLLRVVRLLSLQLKYLKEAVKPLLSVYLTRRNVYGDSLIVTISLWAP